MSGIGIITDTLFRRLKSLAAGDTHLWSPNAGLPTVADLAPLDTVLLLGPLRDPAVATQLAGVLKLALEESKGTLVLAFEGVVADADHVLLRAFGHPDALTLATGPASGTRYADFSMSDRGTSILAADDATGIAHDEGGKARGYAMTRVESYPSAFHAYFTEYGMTATGFRPEAVENATPIGYVVGHVGGLQRPVPAALCWELENEDLYVLPYHLSRAGDASLMVETLLAAIEAHRDALPEGLPPYLSELRLGKLESELLSEIGDLQATLDDKNADAARLARWRHLVGLASGAPLVGMVVEALNVVLDGSGYRCELREDVGLEDFWVVGPDADFALGEAKGVGRGITLANVTQVGSHRARRALTQAFPGLLVVNAFRADADLTRKRTEDVAPDVIAVACDQNVVVVRTWELYQLLGRKHDRHDDGNELIAALRHDRGGWLRVEPSGVKVVR